MPPQNVIAEIRRQRMTVLMVEQSAALALCMADRAYIMEKGRIALEGAARDLLDNADVCRAHLGASAGGPARAQPMIKTAVASTLDDLMSASARLASASA